MKSFKDLSEQHAEKGRFKPVKPHNVVNKSLTTPRDDSDSANVKLKEDFDVCQHCQSDPCICDDSHGFVTETKRMSAAVKLQRAFEREQSKSAASRSRMATAKEQDAAFDKLKAHMSKPETMGVLKRLKNEGYNDYHNNRTGFAKREREDDEYHNGPDPVKHTFTHTVSKEGGEKPQRTVTTGLTTRPKHEFEHMAKQHLEKQGYTIHEETKPSKEEKPPFDGPYKKKSSATPGKYGSGYSTARHLARQAMSKFSKPVKEESEYSRKAQIVKNAKKSKKTDDKFEPEPELGTSVVKADN